MDIDTSGNMQNVQMDNGDEYFYQNEEEDYENNQEDGQLEPDEEDIPVVTSKELDELMETKNETWEEIKGIMDELTTKVNYHAQIFLVDVGEKKEEIQECVDELAQEFDELKIQLKETLDGMVGEMEDGDARCSDVMEYLKHIENTLKGFLD